MARSNRIFWAIHQVGLKPLGAAAYTAVHGAQSVGITTSFNLEQVFELGQIAIYENIENIPDVEVTIEKVLDGYPLVYVLATKGAADGSLAGRSAVQTMCALSIFIDTDSACDGNSETTVEMSGMYIGSVNYNFPVDGNFSETVTVVGNHKEWYPGANNVFDGAFTGNNDIPLANNPPYSGGVNRREDLLWDFNEVTRVASTNAVDVDFASATAATWTTVMGTILPNEIEGISASGTNDRNATGERGAHVQNITVACDFGREPLNELGRKGPYFRYVTFPTEVTCEVEVLSVSGDLIGAKEEGVLTDGTGNNLSPQTIAIVTREGTLLDLGDNNKLSSVSYTGGDAGGSNVSVTYSYSNFNELTVLHMQDPTGLSA